LPAFRGRRSLVGVLAAVFTTVLVVSTASADVGPGSGLLPNGRQLTPAGKTTAVGNFPAGGAFTPDGKYFWVVDAGHGKDDIQIVNAATRAVVQVLPLPGAYGAITFAPGGRTAYVSGEPKGSIQPEGSVSAPNGDAIHVFSVNPASGKAAEQTPITLPPTTGGYAQTHWGAKLGWPEGLAVTPDGRRLVVALNQADQAAVVDLTSGAAQLVHVGRYPSQVAITPDGRTAYVSNEYDGTLSAIDLSSAAPAVTASIGVGGTYNPDGSSNPNTNAHPEGMVFARNGRELYVAVANRDLIAVVDSATNTVQRYISVAQKAGYDAEPLALALSPDGRTLYSADAGEDALADIDLSSGTVAGRIPTAAYPTGVALTPNGRQVAWIAAKGMGTGANPNYGANWANSNAAPYGSYVLDKLQGGVGFLPTPSGSALQNYTAEAAKELIPTDTQPPPGGTPVVGANGGPSQQIKYVFYFERENRTYDQVFGSDHRGNGDPSLELLDDNGVSGPAGGITPNAHALSRQFGLLDHFFSDSEVSQDGHQISASGMATDFVEGNQNPGYSGRGRNVSNDDDPAAAPPRDYLFDQAIREGISFRNYGEYAAKTTIDDGRPTFAASVAHMDGSYPGDFGCNNKPAPAMGVFDPSNCSSDSGTVGTSTPDPASRFDTFQTEFKQQLATNTVPEFNYFILPNDHTNGEKSGFPTPQALVADNDYGLGQFVDLISHSKIWGQSAIFVAEDDSQDGADHLDAHRQPGFVISPWAKHGAVVHTRYDQDSIARTMELITGMKPLSLHDALAAPMYDVFTNKPDMTPYNAIKPTHPMNETVSAQQAASIPLGSAAPFNVVDLVPQEVSDAVLWKAVYGPNATPPPAGPDASVAEEARALVAMQAFQHHQNVKAALSPAGGGDG
jgi:YVTN family beta-propeller protein